jgi:DNA-binding MarR family transcriptional regulator
MSLDLFRSPGYLVNRLAHAMANELDRRLRPHGVTPTQWAVLAVLWREEGLAQVELQDRFGLDGATVTGVLRRMARAGLLRRSTDARDGRVHRVFLTERGRALQEVLVPLAEDVNASALGTLSAEERAVFVELLLRALDGAGAAVPE